MAKRVIFFLSLIIFPLLSGEKITWYKTIEKAKEIALRGKRPLLIFQSDGSIWSKKIEKIFEEEAFQEKGKYLFTFCKSNTVADQSNVPKITLLDPEYGMIAEFGYFPSNKMNYLTLFQDKIQTYLQVKKAILHPDEYDLAKMYVIADELNCKHFQQKLLEIGLKNEEGTFFLMLQYENLLKQNSKSTNISALKEEILRRDAKNLRDTHFKIAMLNFHTLALKNISVKETIEPLLEYVKKFRHKDRKNLWKIYMTMSQYLSTHKDYKNALIYARDSYKEAPKAIKKIILDSIKYLRKQQNKRTHAEMTL